MFRQLLSEAEITSSSRWVEVKRQLWNDERLGLLEEKRRREIFEEYQKMVTDLEDAKAVQKIATPNRKSKVCGWHLVSHLKGVCFF